MNVYSTSTTMSTDIPRLEQELATAQEIGARPETIESIQERLQKAKEEKSEEDKYQGIEHIKRWSNHYLLKRYDEATKQGNELFEKNNHVEFESVLTLIEQVEDEGRARQLFPFIPESKFEYNIIYLLGQLTLTEGFVPCKRIAEGMEYPTDRLRPIIERLHKEGKILRYMEEELWAVSVATRERLGIVKIIKKGVEEVRKL